MYENGLKVTIHLDIYGRPHEKSMKLIGSKGRITWNESSNIVKTYSESGSCSESVFTMSRDEIFIEVAKEFLQVLRGGNAITCSYLDGIQSMQIIDAVEESNRSRNRIRLR